jgi:hypothetical protein
LERVYPLFNFVLNTGISPHAPLVGDLRTALCLIELEIRQIPSFCKIL